MYEPFSSDLADGPNGENAHWEGRTFIRKDGVSFTHHDSLHPELSSTMPLTFPCTPDMIYVCEGTPGFESVFANDEGTLVEN